MKIVILALLPLATLATEHLLGSSRCTWGPSYWCHDIRNSRECFATSHCIEHIWQDQTLPEDDDEVCTICKNMVKEARDTLRSNETISELRQVFDGSCALIPIRIVRQECMKLAEDFIPELVETLSSEMNPQIVCSTSGLCNSARVDRLLAQHYRENPKTECDVCKTESYKIAHKINQLAEKDILDKLYEICGYFGSYSDSCRATVHDNFELIQDMLNKIGKGELCYLVGICSETNANQLAVYKPGGNIECEFCEKVIKHWVNTWTANTTVDEFKQVLEALCHRLKNEKRLERCMHIVEDYYIPWFEFLMHEIDPHEVCSVFGLCGKTGVMKVHPESSVTLLLNPSEHDLEPPTEPQQEFLMQGNQLIGGYFMPRTAIIANKPGCAICEYAMTTLTDWLGQNKTEAEVEEAVENLCNRLPSSVKDQCDNLVETYGRAIIKMLVHDIQPEEICARLGLCTGNILGQQLQHANPEIQILKRSEDSCALCEFGMNYLFSILNDTTDQREIENLLDSLCIRLPNSISNECEKMVAEYTGPIIRLIVRGLNPDEICAELEMCSKHIANLEEQIDDSVQEINTHPIRKSLNDERPYCTLCELAIGEVDKLITDKQNEEEIKEILDDICYKLRAPIAKECANMVNQYMDDIIDMFVKEYTPEQICVELHLCKPTIKLHPIMNEIPSGNARPALVVPIQKVRSNGGPYCVICEFAMTIVDKQILNNKTFDMVERAVQMVCSYMPETVAERCEKFVDEYGDDIIKIIAEDEMNPKNVCTALELCTFRKPLHDARPFGGHLCVWGPSYWCQTRAHARICGTTEHCERYVWKH